MATAITDQETPGTLHTKIQAAFDEKTHDGYKYSKYLPVYDNETKCPAAQLLEFRDRGLDANPAKTSLLQTGNPNVKFTSLTPRIGTEIRGLQMSALTDTQKNELALLIAERGVVVFRDQDFKDIGPVKQKEFGQYFGPLHAHTVGPTVQDYLEFHNLYIGPDNLYHIQNDSTKLTTTGFHSDVSYELQPPGITILTMFSVPDSGGDTTWGSQVVAYERLSEPIKKLLEGLYAEHSGHAQAQDAIRDGKFLRREPTKSYHPVVRVHPATGEKALYVNKFFTTRIVGLKDEESDAILKLLFEHIVHGADFQVRVKWDERTVVLWDNRITTHTAIHDYNMTNPEERPRHAFRITAIGEKPEGVNGLQSKC